MNEMIERVARAICPDWFGDNQIMPNGEHFLNNYPGQHLGYQERARKQARAAIEAMRAPTQAMINAPQGEEQYETIWKEMIDAALTEAACSPACDPTILATQK